MDQRRLFVCVDPSAEAVARLGEVVDGLEVSRTDRAGRSTRLTARDRWHVTLAFLGDVATDRIPSATAALDRAWRAELGQAGGPADPLTGRGARGGPFGPRGSAILWGGLGGPAAPLRRPA